MADPVDRLRRFLRELKRRNVYRVAITYAVVAFLTFQAAELLFPVTTLEGLYDELVLLAFVGFPIALVLAWAFEMTPEGVRRTPPPDRGGEAPGARGPGEPDGGKARPAVKALVGLGLLAGAAAAGWYLTGGGGQAPEVSERSVAVLPFQVSGAAAEDWRDGMVTMLSTGLDGAAGLRALADRTVFAAWEERGREGGGASTEEALAVARGIGAEHAVVGSAVALGDEIRFSAAVHETRSGERLGQAEVRGPRDSVTDLADELTRRVLGVLLQEGEEALPSVDLGSVTTRSLPALKAYLEGERRFRATEFDSAAVHYRRAIAEDTSFALAYWRLATTLGWQVAGEFDQELRYRQRAYGLADRLPRREGRMLRASWLFHNLAQATAAADSVRQITSTYPDDPEAWHLLGEILYHADVPGGWPAADEAWGRAVELDPGHAPYHIHRLQLAIALRHDSALAARRADAYPSPEALEPWFPLAMDLAFGGPDRRRAAVARVDSFPDPDDVPMGILAPTLLHPADGPVYEAVTRRISPKYPLARTALADYLLRRGRLEEALGVMPRGPHDDLLGCALSDAMSLGYPVPDSVADPYLEPSRLAEDASLQRLLCAGVYLVGRGREQELDGLLDRLDASGGDTTGGPSGRRARAENVSAILRGHRAKREGDLERAARLLTGSVYPPTAQFASCTRGIWRGDLLRELDRPERAEGWYLTAWCHPLAHERLGRLYEDMDRPDEAVAAYRRFVDAWEEADPELQPPVERARERLEALTGG